MAEGLGIPVLDLLDTFANESRLERIRAGPFDLHPNERGHELLCENLYRKLKAQPAVWSLLTGDASGR